MGRVVLVLLSLLVYQLAITVDAQTKFIYGNQVCEGKDFNYTRGSVYESNLELLLIRLTSKSSSLKFDNYTVGNSPNQVYGLFQCRYDLSLDDCSKCVKAVTTEIVGECLQSGESILWYEECMVRYSNRNIFSLSETSPVFFRDGATNVTDTYAFYVILDGIIKELNENASSAMPPFASGKSKSPNSTMFEYLYSYAQCTPDIDRYECYKCLKAAFSEFDCCVRNEKGMVSLPSCHLRYDITGPFLNDLPSPPPPPPIKQGLETGKKISLKPAIIGAIAACIAVGLVVLSVVLWLCLCRKRHKEAARIEPPASPTGLRHGTAKSEEESLGDREFVQYDFATLKIVTRDFSAENKLGEGGFGSVYKGTIENGEQLAIKRLSGTSGQGTKEFMTEARLLAKLQHRNLVKLVGFCSEGDEKLLVYEFMANASLDGFLFDASKRPLLDWVMRHKIITGIARGLQYLHEDSRLTIIHRDLKPGNILLDNEMNPKIADFGLAKLFEVAQRFGNTSRIAGTLGYMAPEYMLTGEYSDKSDVYSFGIMLLEIVSGQNNIKFYKAQQMVDLPVYAWKLWNQERSYELTDPALLINCTSNEVMRCIQIGLLCLQANAEERPKMASVAVMLTSSVDLPLPSAPAMSFPQFNMPMNYTGEKHRGTESTDQYFTKSDTVRTDVTQDLHPQPR